jgi:predicted dehydrogenase
MHEVLAFDRTRRTPSRCRNENGSTVDTRIAVIGAGAWGRNFVRCLAELGRLETVVDIHPDRTEDLVSQYGVRALAFDQVWEDPAIEAVVIATPPSSHYSLAKRALQAGKHVLVEKPLTLDLDHAEELIDMADALGLRLMVGHILQYHPAVTRLSSLVAEGAIGRVLRIHANRMNLGAVRRDEDVLWCLGPHDISTILSLVGAEPTEIVAVGGYHLRDSVADTATLHMSFPGGEQAQVNLSWLHPVKEQRFTVIGSSGMLVFDDAEPWERKLLLYKHQVNLAGERPVAIRSEPLAIALEPGEPLKIECEHFVDCIRTGATPRTGADESLRVMRVLTEASAAMESARAIHPDAAAAAEPRLTAIG